ncbi:MAG: GNAT family N-acetyltransferase [Chloroflexi bacterium GWB2_49_20]|nr:MAG: GNAT family N-acetyltransferase [Chloroflexi bacterium GWB2_49_20]OGN80157.1 MAG: GNAT family N-acetyltransferase [Chloroflexi bacterium GWC2_49_37]OGN83130.1 MAG: GNAT family N-acetyltransferase [Chloroflexi bacterium GWD2_49_16]
MTEFKPIFIPTKRLTLRFLGEADLPALYELYSHPDVMRYWSSPAWTDIAQAQQMLKVTQEGYLTGSVLQLGIERNADHVFLGTCSLFQFHVASRRAEMGYALSRPYWGSGYMHEALQVFLGYAFQTLDINRVEADIDPRNRASAKTLERLGFQKEGHLRERWIVNDEVSDTWLYGLLRREWQECSNKG